MKIVDKRLFKIPNTKMQVKLCANFEVEGYSEHIIPEVKIIVSDVIPIHSEAIKDLLTFLDAATSQQLDAYTEGCDVRIKTDQVSGKVYLHLKYQSPDAADMLNAKDYFRQMEGLIPKFLDDNFHIFWRSHNDWVAAKAEQARRKQAHARQEEHQEHREEEWGQDKQPWEERVTVPAQDAVKNARNILDVKEDASWAEIRRAYHRMVHQYHSKIGFDEDAVEDFKRGQAAYELLEKLRDAQKKRSTAQGLYAVTND